MDKTGLPGAVINEGMADERRHLIAQYSSFSGGEACAQLAPV